MEQIRTELSGEQIQLVALGDVMGQHRAMAAVAGKCSAVQAAALARLKSEKLYLKCTPTWDQFCDEFLTMSRSEADKTIRLWEEFGVSYFEMSQLTRVSAATFRAIASAVIDGALHHNGEVIDLTLANAHRVAAAVADLRRAARPSGIAGHVPAAQERLAALDRRGAELLADLDAFLQEEAHAGDCLSGLTVILRRWQSELARIEARASDRVPSPAQ